jgi:hypothetical protein
MSRMADLLDKAAEALEQGDDPFHFSFLSEHEVESGECIDMASLMATGARIMAWVSRNPAKAGAFMEHGASGLAYKAFMDAMDRLNRKAG